MLLTRSRVPSAIGTGYLSFARSALPHNCWEPLDCRTLEYGPPFESNEFDPEAFKLRIYLFSTFDPNGTDLRAF